MQAEPSNDAGNQLTIPVLTDQYVRARSPILQGHHQLPVMPKREDDPRAGPMQLIDHVQALQADAKREAEEPDKAGA